MTVDPYNEHVRDCFSNPKHAGDLQSEYQNVCAATISESVAGDRLTVAIGIEDGVIAAARFRADACPHMIAAAETVCADLEQQAVSKLGEFDPHEIMRRLSVPQAKIGKILVLEDVLKTLAQKTKDST